MISRLSDFRSHDHKIIAERIFYNGFRFVDVAFSVDDPRKDKVENSLKELMTKLAKVVNEARGFQMQKHAFEKILPHEVVKGVTSIPTLELQQTIENFLTQAIGALDIFATQFLNAIFDYSCRDWKHKEIIKYLKERKNLDKETREAIENLLNKAWNDWLGDFNHDRNLHHEANFELSGMSIVDSKPFLKLTRRNGDEITDVMGYLTIHWNKIFWLIENMIRLSFCALRPDLKIIFTSEFKSWLNDEQIDS